MVVWQAAHVLAAQGLGARLGGMGVGTAQGSVRQHWNQHMVDGMRECDFDRSGGDSCGILAFFSYRGEDDGDTDGGSGQYASIWHGEEGAVKRQTIYRC